MANTNQDQALYEMSQMLEGDYVARLRFEQHIRASNFGNRRGGAFVGPWRTNPRGDITCIDLLWSPYLLGSLRIAMLKEIIGIGPQRYYVYYHPGVDFYRKLKLIMTYLPHEKMFLYPGEVRLGGPFLQEPWLSRGQALWSRPSLSFEVFHDNFITPSQ